jgi:CHAD domain-containing protein
MTRNGAISRTAPRREESGPGERLRTVSAEVLAEARRQVDEPEADDATAVHEFRKAMKRWRSILRLYEPMFGDDATQLRLEARDLARELARTRDARAALDALKDLDKETLSARTRATLKGRLEAIGASAEAATLTDDLRHRMRDTLDHATSAEFGWPVDEVSFAAIADGLAASYGRARDAIPKDWSSAAPEAMHRFRQRVVVHRYQMELAVPLWPKIGRVWVAEAQKLRDRLGHYQDLTVLRNFTAPHQPLAPWRSRLLPLITARQAEHAAAAERVARRIFAEKPKAFRRRLMGLWESRKAKRRGE